MNFFVPLVCSVLISAGVTLALLAWVRSRLARQFSDIERRLVQAEREIQAIKSGQESAAVAEQLKRLHKGLARTHENVAERYGPLVPLAEELRDKAARRRFLGDYAFSRLERWSGEVGAPVSRPRIAALAGEVAALDAGAEAPDFEALLAALIALQRWRNGGLSVAVSAAAPGWLKEVVSRSTALGAVDARDNGADATLSVDAAGFADLGKGVVFLCDDMPTAPPEFTLVASQPRVWVYEKTAHPDE